jgi:hypothetical protein
MVAIVFCGCGLICRAQESLTNQLTDGGPSVTPELPDRVAGPPFGAAPGWPICYSRCRLRNPENSAQRKHEAQDQDAAADAGNPKTNHSPLASAVPRPMVDNRSRMGVICKNILKNQIELLL